MPHLETKAERIEYLKRLHAATDDACRLASKQKVDGAINWGDLHCCGAEYRMDELGDGYFAVSVEEAAPDAGGLQIFIAKHLKEARFGDVIVETEW